MSIQFSGLASGIDTDNIIKELMSVERMKVERVEKDKTKAEWKKDVWEEMNAKIFDFYSKQAFDLRSSGTFSKREVSGYDSNQIGAEALTGAARGTHTIRVTRLATGVSHTSKAVDEAYTATEDFTFKLNGQDINIAVGDNVHDFLNAINSADVGVTASYDATFDRIFLNTSDTGALVQIDFTEANTTAGEENFFVAIGFNDGLGNIEFKVGLTGQDAEFYYNGSTANELYTSKSNNVTINGMQFTFKQVMSIEATINVTQDTDAIYSKVKDFVLGYNELVLEINEKINAESAREYQPLTNEEKESMSDDDIKLWEDRIKDSLLRRDSTLTSLRDSMRGIIGSSIGVDTTGFTHNFLSDLGIVTGDFTERGILHIHGDEDNTLHSMMPNKLREAIESDPDKVAQLLNAIGSEVYSTMQDKMSSTSLSSALTFFNDKHMNEQIKEYEDRILDLEERLVIIEERYYKQFIAMEMAIQRMNNQSGFLASMFGGE